MRFSPWALLVCVAFFAMLTLSLSGGSAGLHLAEAVTTGLILACVGGFALRGRFRSR